MTDNRCYREFVEYQMPENLAKDLISEARKNKDGRRPQEILCEYVNTQLRLKGYCIKVHY